MILLLTGFTLAAILPIIIKLVIAGLIAYICWWALAKIAPPEPFYKIAQVLIVLVVAIYCITLLLQLG